MSEDCKNCGTAMWDLDEEGLCPRCSNQEIDLLTTCGTFNTQDCISVEDLWNIVEQEKNNE